MDGLSYVGHFETASVGIVSMEAGSRIPGDQCKAFSVYLASSSLADAKSVTCGYHI